MNFSDVRRTQKSSGIRDFAGGSSGGPSVYTVVYVCMYIYI